jgi:hypothetical protein
MALGYVFECLDDAEDSNAEHSDSLQVRNVDREDFQVREVRLSTS